MMLDPVYIAEQNQGMDDQPGTTTDSPPKRFQFTIVNFFEATIACSVLILIIPSGVDVAFVVGYLTFYAVKSLITIIGVKRKLIGVVIYAALWVPLLAVLQSTDSFPLLLSVVIYAFVPTATFAIDLTGDFVRPRTLIWRPIAEFFVFYLWANFWFAAAINVR